MKFGFYSLDIGNYWRARKKYVPIILKETLVGGGVGRNVKEEKQNKRNESIRPLPPSVKKKYILVAFV